jgi:hypothetical protein
MSVELTKREFVALLAAIVPGCSRQGEDMLFGGESMSEPLLGEISYYRATDREDAKSISPESYPAYIFVEQGSYRGIWVVTE